MENLTPEQKTDKMLELTNEFVKIAKENKDDVSKVQEVQSKMGVEFQELLGKVDTGLENVNTQMKALTEKEEHENESIFRQIIGDNRNEKDIRIASILNYYDNPIEKALYTPKTKFVNGVWVKSGNYDIDPELMKMNDLIFISGMTKALKERNQHDGRSYKEIVKGMTAYKFLKAELERTKIGKALSTSGNSDWVPTATSAELIDSVRLALRVGALFTTTTMPAGAGSWDYPYNPDVMTAYKVPESISDDASKIPAGTKTSSKITITAVKHALRLLWSYEIDEDSVIAIMPDVMLTLRDALVRSQEYAIVNGDDSATHMDSDVTSTSDAQKSWKGIRYYSGNSAGTAAVDMSTFSLDGLFNIRKAMGAFGVNPEPLRWVTSINGYFEVLKLDGVQTIDKFGPKATIIAGQLASIMGSPLIVSPAVRQDMNASGVYDGVTKTKSEILCVHSGAFKNFEKPSGIKIENDSDIATQQKFSVASRRLDFKRMITPGTNEATVGVGYNF